MDDRATLLPRHTMYHHFCSLELDQAGPTDTNYGAGWGKSENLWIVSICVLTICRVTVPTNDKIKKLMVN